MLDPFIQTHKYLVEHVQVPMRRQLMDEIDWNDRLIAIKGGRGVGKTDFLLAYAREKAHRLPHEALGETLYVNFNNFYFSRHSITEFASEFVKKGGKTLLLDQVFKYPNWMHELRVCHDKHKALHIVFAASPVMDLEGEECKELVGILKVYNLRGFSLREYLNLQAHVKLDTYSLDDILQHHEIIAREVLSQVRPQQYMDAYLHHGYYPSYLENRNFSEELLRTMNMALEVDVLIIKQIDVPYLNKIRKLLYLIMENAPYVPNVSTLSEQIETSRATTMNYLGYMQRARLINLLYDEGKSFPSKPSKVYLQNTNLAFMNFARDITMQDIAETFFYNSIHSNHKINSTERNAMFVVDGKHYFDVKDKMPVRTPIRPTAVANIEYGRGNAIPLWLFGFLY